MGNNVVYYSSVKNLAELCKGSTADSDSVCLGSNPSSAAKENRPSSDGLFFFPLAAEPRLLTQLSPFMARIGFAFERKPSGSSLTSGEAKNLRALHEYPSSDSSPPLYISCVLCYTNCGKAVEL